MAWKKGVSREEQIGKAGQRVATAKSMLVDGFAPPDVRRSLRDHFNVSAMTAWRDVEVALGAKRYRKQPTGILLGLPQEPGVEAFRASLVASAEDHDVLTQVASAPDPAVILAARQLASQSGPAFRVFIADKEARIALGRHWKERSRKRVALSGVGPGIDSDSKAARDRSIKALDRFVASRSRDDSRWR